MSIALAIVLVGLTSLAVALLLLPLLLRRGRSARRDAYNLAVYRDQLADVERDAARGLLSPEQAEAARAEIGRRILNLGAAANDPGEILAHPKPVAAATVAILLLPVAALLIYAALGSPSLPDQPFAARHGDDAASAPASTGAADPSGAAHIDMQRALAELRVHLQAHPDDLTGWLLLGRSEVGLGRFREGADAYRHAVDLSGHRADIVGDWGEALALMAGGTVTPAARQAFEAGLKDPAAAPRARYYLALARFQQGDVAGALQAWRALEADSPADAAWLPIVRQRIAEAETGRGGGPPATASATAPPSEARETAPARDAASDGGMPSPGAVTAAADASAGASAEQRRAMIDAMVARLAARLEQQPDDVDGWARLGRSYMVLGLPAKARDAYAHALKLKPNDLALKQAFTASSNAATDRLDRKSPGALGTTPSR